MLDSNDKAHISYYDFDTGSLKYATNKSGPWEIYTIQSGDVNDCVAPIALDSKGNVHIGYSSGSGDLMYATNISGTWATYLIEATTWTNQAGNISLAIDSNDKVHISYFHLLNFDLKYAANASGNWATSVLVNGYNGGPMPGYSTSIAIDKDNYIHIIYYDDTDNTVKYITNKTGWVSSIIDNIYYAAGYGTSIGIDSNNVIHVSYLDYDSGTKYANNSTGAWQTILLDNIGMFMSLAIDLDGNVHICSEGPVYATNRSGTWKYETVNSSGGGVAIDTDSNNLAHISYYGDNTLEYAYKAPEEEFPWELFIPAITGH